jgi:hypothetical protein
VSQFQFGNISGTNQQFGNNNTQNVTMTQSDRELAAALLETLRQQIHAAPIPDAAKKTLTQEVIPQMQAAARQPDPKPGLTHGLEAVNTHLEKVNTAATSVTGIVETVAKLAKLIGTGVGVVAPFLAALL